MPSKYLGIGQRSTMFFAVTSSMALLSLCTILTIVSFQNWEVIETALLELVFVGKIPGTNLIISFEALAAGVIFGIWLICTYKFYALCIEMIGTLLKPDEAKTAAIEKIAL